MGIVILNLVLVLINLYFGLDEDNRNKDLNLFACGFTCFALMDSIVKLL